MIAMKRKLVVTLILLTLTFGTVLSGAAQQSSEPGVQALKEVIQKLEAVEKDSSTPPEVKGLNSGFLQARRRQLQMLLQDRVSALRQYLANLRTSLTADEVRAVEESIQSFEKDLSQLSALLDRGVSTAPGDARRQSDNSQAVTGSSENQTRSGPKSENGDDSSPKESAGVTSPTSSSPVPAARRAPGALSPVTTDKDLPTPQNCDDYKAHKQTFSLYEQYVCDLIERAAIRKATGKTPIELTGPQFFNLSVILIAQKLRSTFLVDAEEARVDKQVGSSSSNSGSTSLVTKGGTPAVLGFAVENGALERDISGSTITFRGNPVGLVDMFRGLAFMTALEDDSPATRLLRKTSFAFSFDTDRGSQPGVFTATKQQLSAFSGRVEFINKRDPRLREYKNDWENFLSVNAQPFADTLVDSKDVLIERVASGPGLPIVEQWRDKALETWYEETQAEITKAAPGNVETVMKAQLAKLPIGELSAETVTALTNFARQFGVYLEGRKRILNRVAKGTVATFEFINKRNINEPDTLNFKGIYETAFGGKADFTFNGSLTLLSKRPTINVSRVRDFQFAGQLDLPLGDVTKGGPFVLSASAKYQRLMENASNPLGAIVPNTKGDIAIGQLKLTIPIKGLGIRFPISVSFANRTELIKEKTVRGNFGVTFDLDSILAKFNPF
jgi:hypothetical protein